MLNPLLCKLTSKLCLSNLFSVQDTLKQRSRIVKVFKLLLIWIGKFYDSILIDFILNFINN